ncbi:MAG: hypothetical protein R3C68_00630 [Myxococcota bacterium]
MLKDLESGCLNHRLALLFLLGFFVGSEALAAQAGSSWRDEAVPMQSQIPEPPAAPPAPQELEPTPLVLPDPPSEPSEASEPPSSKPPPEQQAPADSKATEQGQSTPEKTADAPQPTTQEETAAPAAAASAAAVAVAPTPTHEEVPEFIRGDLVHVGTVRLLSRFDHVGVAVGPYLIDNDLFLSVTPAVQLTFEEFALSLHLPLHLLALEGGSLEYGGLKVRREDWDQAADYAKVIRYFTIGRKEEPLYFSINTQRPVSVGHGMLINNYQGSIDVDRSMTSLVFDMSRQFGGFELFANDVTFTNQIF